MKAAARYAKIEADCANFAAPAVQAATALIADSATERGLEVSAE
jgi:hypothetical protein